MKWGRIIFGIAAKQYGEEHDKNKETNHRRNIEDEGWSKAMHRTP